MTQQRAGLQKHHLVLLSFASCTHTRLQFSRLHAPPLTFAYNFLFGLRYRTMYTVYRVVIQRGRCKILYTLSEAKYRNFFRHLSIYTDDRIG